MATTRAPRAASLRTYRAKRDFNRTPEPSGERKGRAAEKPKRGKAPRGSLRFVVQEHAASRLHYDFRLEARGVLMSWAVPKGPTLVAGERRLAMQTEDHPRDYFDFEGVIPAGGYGAGQVIVWDWGTYALTSGDDPYAEMERGKIAFELFGEKLAGRFVLVKMKGRTPKDNAWLLLKEHDAHEDPRFDVKRLPASAKTGRTLEDVASDRRPKTWISDRPAARVARAPHASRKAAARPASRTPPREPLPAEPRPMLATLVDAPFDDPAWLFEIKWDGFRAIATIDASRKVTLTSRNGKDLLLRFPGLASIGDSFTDLPAVVDGEIVSLDARGRSSFQRLQGSPEGVRYVVFDALYAEGRDLRDRPLAERTRILQSITTEGDTVLLSKQVATEGKRLFALAEQQGLEGIIAKRASSRYVAQRSRDWLKIKVRLGQECVVAGYSDPKGSRKGFGSLLLGVYDGERLVYVGDVGTGFSDEALRDLSRRFAKLGTDRSPFVDPPRGKNLHWVTPKLVAQVGFTEWTADGRLRHPVYQGLRDDKDPRSVGREKPKKTPRTARAGGRA